MNKDEKRIALILLENKIYRSDGQAYEDLFCDIMESHNPNFKRVKPQGRIGDRKNDGFDSTAGLYCQVYAPENLHKSEGDAIQKLEEDFAGLLLHWSSISAIRDYYFVLNDKFKGTTYPIEELLSKLKKAHSVNCRSFLNKDLETVFEMLPDHKIEKIVGGIPSPEKLTTLNYSSLNEVLNHLMNKKGVTKHAERPENPDFIKKISFNGLTTIPGGLLTVGDYQNGEIETFFRNRSDFHRIDVQRKFVELYQEGQNLYDGVNEKGDHIFYHILERAKPREEAVFDTPVVALMAYYFEKCDIFEPPN
jgi:hypothetical protein